MMQAELNVEEIVRDRSLKVKLNSCSASDSLKSLPCWLCIRKGISAMVFKNLPYMVCAECEWHSEIECVYLCLYITRSLAVFGMADCTAPVVNQTLTLMGHNLANAGTSPLNGPIMRQNEAY